MGRARNSKMAVATDGFASLMGARRGTGGRLTSSDPVLLLTEGDESQRAAQLARVRADIASGRVHGPVALIGRLPEGELRSRLTGELVAPARAHLAAGNVLLASAVIEALPAGSGLRGCLTGELANAFGALAVERHSLAHRRLCELLRAPSDSEPLREQSAMAAAWLLDRDGLPADSGQVDALLAAAALDGALHAAALTFGQRPSRQLHRALGMRRYLALMRDGFSLAGSMKVGDWVAMLARTDAAAAEYDGEAARDRFDKALRRLARKQVERRYR